MVHYCNKQSLIPRDTQVLGELSLLLNDLKYSLSYKVLNDAQRVQLYAVVEFIGLFSTTVLKLIKDILFKSILSDTIA